VNEEPEDAYLSDVLRRYYEGHGCNTRSADHARASVKHWLDHWGEATVADLRDISRQEAFHAFLLDRMNNNSANRVLDIGKAALNRAYKRGELTQPPYINRLPKLESGPRGRPMTVSELQALYGEAAPHLKTFIRWMLGTAARPEAIRTLHASQVHWEDEVIRLNPEGRSQNKKRRPVIKLPPALNERFDGFLVQHNGKPVGSIKTAWNKATDRAKLDGKCNPYSLRHTASKWMRRHSVSMDEIGQQLGHKEKSTSITAIYTADDPDYLANACAALNKLVMEVTGAKVAHT
jgi:integrase